MVTWVTWAGKAGDVRVHDWSGVFLAGVIALGLHCPAVAGVVGVLRWWEAGVPSLRLWERVKTCEGEQWVCPDIYLGYYWAVLTHGWVCVILGVASASVVVCVVLFMLQLKPASVIHWIGVLCVGSSLRLCLSPQCWITVCNTDQLSSVSTIQ